MNRARWSLQNFHRQYLESPTTMESEQYLSNFWFASNLPQYGLRQWEALLDFFFSSAFASPHILPHTISFRFSPPFPRSYFVSLPPPSSRVKCHNEISRSTDYIHRHSMTDLPSYFAFSLPNPMIQTLVHTAYILLLHAAVV